MTTARYREFRKALKSTGFKGKFMPYKWGNLPSSLFITWMPYSQMFDEFAGEIANAMNKLTGDTHKLAAWRDAIASLSQQQQFDAEVEFVDSLATVALNLPYVIRSRLLFATAHLCHQANRALQGRTWKDDFPLDTEVYFETADTYGTTWRRYGKLKQRLERIAAKDYQAATFDFRNAYNHRFSPRIVLGLSNIVTRTVDKASGAVSYGFGGTPALTLPVVVSVLEEQCRRCYAAFEAFQKLVQEQETAIAARSDAALAAMNPTPKSKSGGSSP